MFSHLLPVARSYADSLMVTFVQIFRCDKLSQTGCREKGNLGFFQKFNMLERASLIQTSGSSFVLQNNMIPFGDSVFTEYT